MPSLHQCCPSVPCAGNGSPWCRQGVSRAVGRGARKPCIGLTHGVLCRAQGLGRLCSTAYNLMLLSCSLSVPCRAGMRFWSSFRH